MKYIALCLLFVAINGGLYAQDAENIERVGRLYNYWDKIHDVAVIGDLAYVTTGFSGLQIMDVSDPGNPEIIGFWDDNLGHAASVTVSGNFAYLKTNNYEPRSFNERMVRHQRHTRIS